MINKISLIIVVISLFFRCSYAAFSKNDAGTTTAQFLKLGAGVRASGMGDAFVGISDDSTAVYWNPAGLCQIKNQSFSVMHAVWFEDISYDWASYAYNMKNLGFIGFGIQYLSYGDIKEIDNTGSDKGTFNPNDTAATISYAKDICNFNLGCSFKYISSKIKENFSAFAFDFGMMHKILNNKLSLGLSIQNMGTKMKFNNNEDSLPFNIKLGSAYFINSNLILVLDLNAPIDNEINFCSGTEYKYKVNNSINFSGRLGYTTKTKDTGGLNGITTGLGINYNTYQLDYAFVPYGDLGNTHRISFSLQF